MNRIIQGIGLVVLGLGVAAFILFGVAWIAQQCWNMFCAYVHLPDIGYWQTWGMLMFLYIVTGVVSFRVEKKD